MLSHYCFQTSDSIQVPRVIRTELDLKATNKLRRKIVDLSASPSSLPFCKDNFSIPHWSLSFIMKWLVLSPGLSPIENVWRMMARDMSTGSTQYSILEELKQIVIDSWVKSPQATFYKLVNPVTDQSCHSGFDGKRYNYEVLIFH